MAVLGLAAIAAAALLPGLRESPLGQWTLMETLAPARVLPLIGLGAAFGLFAGRAFVAALLLFVIGVVIGLVAEDRLLWALDSVPRAATHLFMTGPISYLAAGAALVASERRRSIVAPAAAIIVGAMLALMIKLTDPSLHEPVFTWTPVLIAVWLVVSVSLSLRVFRREWFIVAGRILGSWLIAIGLLYGGVRWRRSVAYWCHRPLDWWSLRIRHRSPMMIVGFPVWIGPRISPGQVVRPMISDDFRQ